MTSKERIIAALTFGARYGDTGCIAECKYTLKVPQANKDAEHDEWRKIDAEIDAKHGR